MTPLATLRNAYKLGTASAALIALGWSNAAFAECDTNLPVDGATVTCSTAAPNPDTTGVGPLTATDSTVLPTGVTVNMLGGASIALPGTVGFPVIRLGQGANVNLAAGSSISTANGGGIAISFNPNRASASSIVDVAGSITSRGTGISFSGPAATITLRQGGSITSGTVANGGNPAIFISPTGASLTNVQIDGAITLLGNTGVGTGAVQSLTATGSRATITLGTTGTIQTSGTNALGIIAQGPSNTVNIAGTITTTGAAASGIVANGAGTASTQRIVSILPTGRINTSGDNAAGIVFGTVLGQLNVAAGGEVRTTGTGNAAALFFLDAGSSTTQVTNNGSLIATNTTAIQGPADLRISNLAGGVISGTTAISTTNRANFISPSSGTVITNAGTITGTGGVAVRAETGPGQLLLVQQDGGVINGTVRAGDSGNILAFTTTALSRSFDWNLINNGGAALPTEQFFGFTSFAKSGPESLTITGGSGTGRENFFTHNGGTLIVNGNLANVSFAVGEGSGSILTATGLPTPAVLAGNGTLGSVTFRPSAPGTLSPGADGTIGTLTINGDLVLHTGSTTRFDIGTTAGSNDRINVTGTASLAGTLTAFPLGTFTAGRYTLINAAGGVSGTFNPLTGSLSNAVSLAYDANNVFLDVTGAGIVTSTQSLTESLVFSAPTTTTAQVTNFSTQIIGRLGVQTTVYDQTFAAAFADPTVQGGVTAARAAINAAATNNVTISDPMRTANSSSTSNASVTNYALAGTQDTVEAGVVTFGPANLTFGRRSTCNIGTLPSATMPTCMTGGTPLVLGLNDTNVNVNTNRVYTISQTITDTATTTIRETYVLTGDEGSFSLTTSQRQSIVFTTPNVTTNRVSAFSTRIVGRLLGGTPLFDQTFGAAFADPTVQGGLTAARVAITTAGGPGVIIGDPVRTSSSMTSSTATGATTFALTGTQDTIQAGVVTFGPATLAVGQLSTCTVSSLPSSTRPTCTDAPGTPLVLGQNDTNANVNTNSVHTVSESRTDTITDTLTETYELNGQVVAVGSVHAQVQSGLFDLGGRLLGRLGQIEQGSAGWAEGYAFRVSQDGRRDALGFAGGFGLQIAEGLTLGFGVDRGGIDIDLPGAVESGEISLTEIGASLRLDSGPFGASLAVVQGFGNADTSRSIIGRSTADYDVRVTGVAFDMGYAFETGGWSLRPSAGIDHVRISSDGFTESDALGLVAGDQSASRTRATAGLSLGRNFGGFSIAAAARYIAVLDGGDRSLPVAFAIAPTRPLDMSGPGEPDGALLGARISIPVARGTSLSLGYDGRFGGGYTAHTGTIALRVSL